MGWPFAVVHFVRIVRTAAQRGRHANPLADNMEADELAGEATWPTVHDDKAAADTAVRVHGVVDDSFEFRGMRFFAVLGGNNVKEKT